MNFQLGPFTVCLDFHDSDGRTTVTSRRDLSDLYSRPRSDLGLCRSVMMRHKSDLVTSLVTFVRLPLYLLDLESESQTIEALMLEDFQVRLGFF